MSGAESALIAVGALAAMSAWVVAVLRPWAHPQHAARYRPDPLEVAAVLETIPYAEVEGAPPWDLEEEATVRAGLGELVFGDDRGGWASGPCCGTMPEGDEIMEATLRRELHQVDLIGVPEWASLPGGERDGPASPSQPGDGGEPEGCGPPAPPAPVSWLDAQLEELFGWVRDQWNPSDERSES